MIQSNGVHYANLRNVRNSGRPVAGSRYPLGKRAGISDFQDFITHPLFEFPMDAPIISVSGLRGIVGQSLDPFMAMRFVSAFSQIIPDGPLVVTRDGRQSGVMLASAVSAAIRLQGRPVLYGDLAATPTTGILVRYQQAAGGVQISASHNPVQYNGIKLFDGRGRVLSEDLGQRVTRRYERPSLNPGNRIGGHEQSLEDTISEHLRLVLATVDVDAIRSRSFHAIVDSNHGAGSLLARQLLRKLNVRAEIIGETPDGQFAHAPEPTAENLRAVANQARSSGADVVFCQDPDADRLALIDETGRFVGEEYTLAITLRNRLTSNPGACVINCATSRMNVDIARRFGCECFITAVGEANVCDEMLRVGAVYGGEGNGGPIDPKVGLVRDSFVGMAQVLEALAKSGQTLSQLVAELPRYAIYKTKTSANLDRLSNVYEAIVNAHPDAKTSLQDGLRLDWDDRWLLIRPSNTEPVVRVICEAHSEKAAKQSADQAIDEICRVAGPPEPPQ